MNKVELSTEIKQTIEREVLKSIKTIAEDVCDRVAKQYFNEFLGNKINIEVEKYLNAALEYQINLVLKSHNLISKNNGELISQSVKNFLNYIDHDYECIIGEPTDDVYEEYCNFCTENKMIPLDKAWFSRELKDQTGITTRVTTVNRKSVRLYTRGSDNE